jgi:hypothetical protein
MTYRIVWGFDSSNGKFCEETALLIVKYTELPFPNAKRKSLVVPNRQYLQDHARYIEVVRSLVLKRQKACHVSLRTVVFFLGFPIFILSIRKR